MDNIVSRTELSPVDRAVVRAPSATPVVQPVAATRTNDALSQERRGDDPLPEPADAGQELASVAEYVEVHARISEILADLGSGASDLAAAQGAVDALIPRPLVLVPLWPASKEAVEHAAAVARRIVQQAAYAHGAQSSLSRPMVEQIAGAGN